MIAEDMRALAQLDRRGKRREGDDAQQQISKQQKVQQEQVQDHRVQKEKEDGEKIEESTAGEEGCTRRATIPPEEGTGEMAGWTALERQMYSRIQS